MSDLTQIFSTAFLPEADAHAAGGLASGFESISSDISLKVWTRRAITVDASLYANCCPRQIRGPALNGRKINGFGTRYFLTRSSRNRSGSNSSAIEGWSYRRLLRGRSNMGGTYHQGPKDPSFGALTKVGSEPACHLGRISASLRQELARRRLSWNI